MKILATEPRTIILYESPHRLVKSLRELAEHCGPERQAAVCRELTKMFEETKRGTLEELAAYYEAKPPIGDIVLLLAGAE